MQKKIVFAGVESRSFGQATRALEQLAELTIPSKQVERITKQIGQERCLGRDAQVQAYQELPLVERKATPEGTPAPEAVVVQMDGGRLQILDRTAPKASTPQQPSDADASRSDSENGKHWREDKVGFLATLQSEEFASDPCPEIPKNFVDPQRVSKLAKELKSMKVPQQEEPAQDDANKQEQEPEPLALERWQPELIQRSVVATRCGVDLFGPMLAQAAWQRGFAGASRKAFVADGLACNWTMWKKRFSDYTPILDFIHALSYVYASSMAGRPFEEGWSCYTKWIDWVWSGQVEEVLEELSLRTKELGPAQEDDSETSPRRVVSEALGYLENQKSRMNYPEYRRRGLPTTSSWVESIIKQINQRVKGTEKFWSEKGAEAILQLRADHLSETEPMLEFWEHRQKKATGESQYRSAV